MRWYENRASSEFVLPHVVQQTIDWFLLENVGNLEISYFLSLIFFKSEIVGMLCFLFSLILSLVFFPPFSEVKWG